LVHAPKGTAVTASAAYAPVSNAVTTGGRFEVSLRCSGALSGIALARPEGVASGWSEIALAGPRPVTGALAETTLIEALLSLRYGRARFDIALRSIKSIRDVSVVVRHPPAVHRIVHPVVAVCHSRAIEVVSADEIVVDHHVVASPSATPTPTSPTAAPNRAYRHAKAKRDRARGDDGAGRRRIVYRRIGIIYRRPQTAAGSYWGT